MASAVPGDLNADGSLALAFPSRKGLTCRPMAYTAMRHAPGEDMVAEYVDMMASRRQEAWPQPVR